MKVQAKEGVVERIGKFVAAVEKEFGLGLYVDYGRRNVKITNGRSVYCFVDLTNGDVLMAASYKAPARHARSNVFDKDFGLSGVNQYGANYLV